MSQPQASKDYGDGCDGLSSAKNAYGIFKRFIFVCNIWICVRLNLLIFALVAQGIEHSPPKRRVARSIRAEGANCAITEPLLDLVMAQFRPRLGVRGTVLLTPSERTVSREPSP